MIYVVNEIRERGREIMDLALLGIVRFGIGFPRAWKKNRCYLTRIDRIPRTSPWYVFGVLRSENSSFRKILDKNKQLRKKINKFFHVFQRRFPLFFKENYNSKKQIHDDERWKSLILYLNCSWKKLLQWYEQNSLKKKKTC